MYAFLFFIPLLLFVLLLAYWLNSAFEESRRLRITLSVGMVIIFSGVAFLLGNLGGTIDDNLYYHGANKLLLSHVIAGMDAGETESVLNALKELDQQYHMTYEHRAEYAELVEEAVEKMPAKPK